jgi:HlyD family secretion protein
MRRILQPVWAGVWRRYLLWVAASGAASLGLGLTAGCNRPGEAPPAESPSAAEATEVAVAKPQRRTVRRLIAQPGYNIEAFQQTPVYAKIPGYVRKVRFDIGDRVRKGDVLAEVWVPEMEVELRQKEAAVRRADAEVWQARKVLAAAEADVKSAGALVKEAEAGRLRAQAQVKRARSQYERLSRAGRGGVIDQESVSETQLGFEASKAALAEVEAKIQSARAARDASRAKRDKAEADVSVAEAHLEVKRADRDHVKTLLGYTRVPAPFDGVVTRRNVDEDHFVQPADSSGARGGPLFTVEQVDPVRVFVNVPEVDAAWVRKDDPAVIRVQGLKGQEFKGKVTRSSYSLDPRARTLRTEIDLPNAGGKLRPGMYVYATILVEHPNVWALPAAAVVTRDEETFCYRVEGGKAVRTPVQVGLSDGKWVEVLKKQAKPPRPGGDASWQDFTGEEQIVQDNAAALKDGQAVKVSSRGK